jgi:cellulose biosynthesis protein BcsQ
MTAFGEALGGKANGYDHVICDCGPSLGSTTLMALAAGPVLVPVETTRLTVAALPRLAAAIAALRRAGIAASVLAYLPTCHANNQTESREALKALRATGRARVLAAVIPQSTAVARSLAEGMSLFDARYRGSRAPSAYLAALGEVVSRLEVRHE